MSPPSLATAGRTRVSISSLMVATVSASAGSKNSSASAGPAPASRRSGSPDMKCSMMAPRIAGLSWCHSPSLLLTVMKSLPKNTPLMPLMPNRRSASGERLASSRSRMSRVPEARTVRPGRNFSVAGLGVASVWMNMALLHRMRRGRRPHVTYTWCLATAGSIRRSPWNGRRPPSRHGVQFFVRQMAGHDGDGNRIGAGRLGEAGDQRARPFLAGAGGQHQDGDVLVLFDQLEDLFGHVAFADRPLRRQAGDAVGAAGELVERGIRRLVRFRLHDVGDAEPLLVAVLRLDHPQHDQAGIGAGGTLARPVDGAVAFRRIVDDDEVLPLVSGFVAAALAAHRASPGFRQTHAIRRTRRDAATSGGAATRDAARIGRRVRFTGARTRRCP